MAVKLDMKCAYDRVEWDFLSFSLHQFSFLEAWITFIQGCIMSPSFAPLVNGLPLASFHFSMGVHQGSPLSSYFFIICVDALSRMLHATVVNSSLSIY